MKASYEEDFFESDYPQITEEKLTYRKRWPRNHPLRAITFSCGHLFYSNMAWYITIYVSYDNNEL